jgi:hypothetical protein
MTGLSLFSLIVFATNIAIRDFPQNNSVMAAHDRRGLSEEIATGSVGTIRQHSFEYISSFAYEDEGINRQETSWLLNACEF